jgi:hypothetical protein
MLSTGTHIFRNLTPNTSVLPFLGFRPHTFITNLLPSSRINMTDIVLLCFISNWVSGLFLTYIFVLFLAVLRPLQMLGKCSTPKPHPEPPPLLFIFSHTCWAGLYYLSYFASPFCIGYF